MLRISVRKMVKEKLEKFFGESARDMPEIILLTMPSKHTIINKFNY
jgi:hypothetical protein